MKSLILFILLFAGITYSQVNPFPIRTFWKDSSGVNVSKNNKRVVITDGLIKHNLYLYDKQGTLSSEMYIDTAAHNNTFLGLGAGRNTTTGSRNNFYGYAAGYSNTTGASNNFYGHYSGYSNTSGIYNNFYGRSAGHSNTTGSYNNFYGYQAGYSNTTGLYNNYFGYQSGYSTTTGTGNNFYGYAAGYSNTTGAYNNFYGYNSGRSNTTGASNNFYGHYSGNSNTSGSYNNFYGYSSGRSNTTGSYNNFYGYNSGRFTSDDTTENDSTNYSVYIGAETKSGAIHTSTNTNEIVIGYNAIGGGSNSVTLGNTDITKTILRGNVGIGTTTPNAKLEIAGSPITIIDSLYSHNEASKIDSATIISIATGKAGWGEVMIGDNEEWAHFRFSSSGAVTLITNTTNVSTTPFNPNTLNIYDAGSGVAIQNYLSAAQKRVAVNIKYFTP